MKKSLQLLSLVAVGLIALVILNSKLYARLTGTNPTGASADVVCFGPKSSEGCFDSSGNIIPTTNNTQTLGTSSLNFSNTYTKTATVGTGGIINSGPSNTSTYQSTTRTVIQGININTIVPVTSSFETVVSSGGAIKLTSVPNISTTTIVGGTVTIPDGTFLVITATTTAGTVTFQDQGTLTGSQLELGAATRTLTKDKTLTLIFDATELVWKELSFGNNQ